MIITYGNLVMSLYIWPWRSRELMFLETRLSIKEGSSISMDLDNMEKWGWGMCVEEREIGRRAYIFLSKNNKLLLMQ